MADEPNPGEEDDFDLDDLDDDFSLPDFDEEIRKAAASADEKGPPVKEAEKIAEKVPPKQEKPKEPPKPQPAASPASIQAAPAPIEGSREDLAIALNIELGRISVPMSKLMELEAGTIMDLGIFPEQGVDLVVGGRCIGKGELVKVGPKIAVRILSIK